jgi:hypothetical protein
MKVRSHSLSPSVARGLAAVCAAVFVAGAHTAQAGINVWTSHGPGTVAIYALAIDPMTPSTLYAGTGSGVFDVEQVAAKVVGNGTPSSCTDAALNAALAGGGLVTFNCGGPATIDISTGTGTKTIAADTCIDGGGGITISGEHRLLTIFSVNPGVNFTVKNLTIAKNLGFGDCGDGLPCRKSAAVANSFGTLTVINSTFTDIDDEELEALSTVAVPGSFVPVPVITGFGRLVFELPVPGVPINPQADPHIFEVFITDGANVLQLTNFQRSDTAWIPPSLLGVDGERVFFTASVNPQDDTNPSETCQVFSVDALGGDLRQLTRFGATRHSALGCAARRRGEGCRADFNRDQKVGQDTRNGTLVFVSTCDPFGTNPNGQQIFAMRPDGSGLHALTDARGLVRNPDGSVEAELPGPWSYGPHP